MADQKKSDPLDRIKRLSDLPDDALLSSKETALVLGTSERTVRYHPQLPRVQISEARYGHRVRDVRKLCREGVGGAS
jgi:hypothetical protein